MIKMLIKTIENTTLFILDFKTAVFSRADAKTEMTNALLGQSKIET